MRKFVKIFLWSLFGLVVVIALLLGGFIYKVRYGFPVSYETEIPPISFPAGKRAVLVFSKATGFRHGESIEAGIATFTEMANASHWFLYTTDEGGVFNDDQLSHFDVVIFNNCTGRLLNETQQQALENYVTQGGHLLGIHGAGDNSHHWEWYTQNLTGSDFSHHTLNPQFQETEVILHAVADSTITLDLPARWTHTDEWYVFFEDPASKGFQVVYTIDGSTINPSGNLLWMTDKDFGMGDNHAVAWYKRVGNGKTFYTSMGHDARAWQQQGFRTMLENFINWD